MLADRNQLHKLPDVISADRFSSVVAAIAARFCSEGVSSCRLGEGPCCSH